MLSSLHYRNLRRSCLLIAFVSVTSAVLGSSPWFVRTWQSDVGLPDNTVVGLGQSPDGFLWVATHGGLVRFDGVQFRPFTPVIPDRAPYTSINSLLLDRRGCLWILDDRKSVVCWDPRQRATTTVTAIPGRVIPPMLEAPDGAIWFAYEGDTVMRLQNGQTRMFTVSDGLPGGGICQLAFDPTGQLWFAQGASVGIFREERFHPLNKMPAERITGSRGGGIWACFNKQLWKCADGVRPVKIGDLPTSLRAISPTLLYEDRTGTVWIGTREAGLLSYNGTNFLNVATSQQTILCLQEDREGSLWVGTRGGGLNQLKPRSVELLSTTEVGAPLEAVTSIAEDTQGVLWAVVWQKGTILRKTAQGWSPLNVDEKDSKAWTLASDPQGGVWIGLQYRGLYHWQNGAITDRYTMANGLAGNLVNALLTTPSGALWIGVETTGERMVLQCLEQGNFSTFPLPDGIGKIDALAVDITGDCWAATSKGRLMRVRQNILTDETATLFPRACVIRSLCVTPDNSLWIGSAGQGLGRLKAGRFSQFTTEHGLPDDYLSNILPDGHGRLWFAGNRGIFSVHEKGFDDIEAGKATRVWPVVYGRNDGLQRLQASHDAWPGALCDSAGRLLFAMQSGVAVVYPSGIKEQEAPPLPVIERVTVNGKTASLDGTAGTCLRLAPGQRQIEFFFTAPTLLMPESIGFKYRLLGLDKTWIHAGTRRNADYSQLVPGNYQFQVAACNSVGVWNEETPALEIIVEPYWWETVWFRVLGWLAAVTLVGGAIFWNIRRRLQAHTAARHQAEGEFKAVWNERNRMARELHDTLAQGLSAISMQLELLKRKLPADSPARTVLEETRAMTKSSLAEARNSIWNMRSQVLETGDLATALDGILKTMPNGCEIAGSLLVTGTPRRLAPVIENNLLRIGQEAIANAVRYARCGQLAVTLEFSERHVALSVRDDGQGFDPEHPPRSEGGFGLAGMRERAEQIHGDFHIISAIGKGATVCVKVPILKT